MKAKTKKITARKGLVLSFSILFAVLVDLTITYIPQANTILNHVKTVIILIVCFYATIHITIRFSVWAIKTLKKK